MQPDPSPAGAAETGSLRQILVILRRRWKLFAVTFATTVAAATGYTLTLPKLFRPQASLEIRPETPLVSSDVQDPALMATHYLWENYYRTQESILTSASLHAAALAALAEPLRKEYEGKPDPLALFSAQVDIEKVRSSFILKIGFIDRDREKATQVVNTLVSMYLEEANRHLREMRSGAAAVLSRETLPAIRLKVDEADRGLQKFQAANGFIDPQEQYSALASSRRTVLERVTQIRLRQMQARAQLDTLKGYGADGGTGIYNPVFHATKIVELLVTQQEAIESELARERRELKDDHPAVMELKDQLARVQARIREAIRGVLRSFENDLDATVQEERSAVEEQGRIEKQMADVNQRVAQYRRLEAELTASRELYNSFLKKHGEETATSGTGIGSVRVIDPAKVPLRPYKPNLFVNVALGAVLGVLLGVAALFVSEQLDDRIRSPGEIEVFLGLDVLAVVPRLGGGSAAPDGPYLMEEGSSVADFETFRALRGEVWTRLEGIAGPKMVAVLSPMSGEGKSTVSVNLAKVLAMDGRRVLIFDGDMRRPSIVPVFAPEGPGPDLEKVLKGEATLAQAIRRSRIPGVDVVGMARGTSQASELAGSARFDEALREARVGYDVVIVDSAPVNQATESGLIARRCDATVLVLRERRTGRGAGQAARRRLEGLGIRVLGAVLNAVEGPESAYGYYGYYYSYYKPRE